MSQTAASLLVQGADITQTLIGYSGAAIKETIPIKHDVKFPKPVLTGIRLTADVTNQGITRLTKKKENLVGTVATTVSSKVPLNPEELEDPAGGEEFFFDAYTSDDGREGSATWKATKKLVVKGSKAFDEILGSIEGSLNLIKGKAEEEVLDVVTDKLGEDIGEILKETISLGSDILALKGHLSPRGVGKGLAKQVSQQIVRKLHQKPSKHE